MPSPVRVSTPSTCPRICPLPCQAPILPSAAVFSTCPGPISVGGGAVGGRLARAVAVHVDVDVDVADLLLDRPAGADGDVADPGADFLGGPGGGRGRVADP